MSKEIEKYMPNGITVKGVHGQMLMHTGEVAAKAITVALSEEQKALIENLLETDFDIISLTLHYSFKPENQDQ